MVASEEVCSEINEIAGVTNPAASDLSADEVAGMRALGVDAQEMLCAEDSVGGDFIAYYRLGSAQ